MFKKILLGLMMVAVAAQLSFGQEANKNERADKFLNSVKEAVAQDDPVETDFWITRFIGELWRNKETERSLNDLTPLISEFRTANPSGSLPQTYHESFLTWFVEESQKQFALADVRVYGKSFELVNGGEGHPPGQKNYFAAVFVAPYVETWNIPNKTSPSYILLGSAENKPDILSGNNILGDRVEYFHTVPFEPAGPMQHVWKPEFEDLDDDEIPELFIRYNYVNNNGVHQELAVFRFENNEPVLIRRFNGEYGGIARRLGDKKVEVGTSDEYSNTLHYETWEYQGSDFKSVSARTGDHILISEDWQQYY